jgi:hypothetical protein
MLPLYLVLVFSIPFISDAELVVPASAGGGGCRDSEGGGVHDSASLKGLRAIFSLFGHRGPAAERAAAAAAAADCVDDDDVVVVECGDEVRAHGEVCEGVCAVSLNPRPDRQGRLISLAPWPLWTWAGR